MTLAPVGEAANKPATPEQIGAAIAAANERMRILLEHPAWRNDPTGDFIKAIQASLEGLNCIYDGILTQQKQIVVQAQEQRTDLAAWSKAQREELLNDAKRAHDIAVTRLAAEEAAQTAKLKVGLFDTMKGTFVALFREERRETFYRALTACSVAAIALFSLGVVCGHFVRTANAARDAANDIAAVAAIAKSTQENAEAVREIGESILRMKPDEFAAVRRLQDVFAPTAAVPGEDVPYPCVAAVPDGTIAVNGTNVSACVIVLKPHVAVRGGTWLINALAIRAQSQQIQPIQ